MPAVGQNSRFGVTASRKVGGAVIRSRCKRRLRELYRTLGREREGRAVDIVANARKSVGSASWKDLEEDFVESVRRGLHVLERMERRKPRPD
jgi:ribonuclease P protein component